MLKKILKLSTVLTTSLIINLNAIINKVNLNNFLNNFSGIKYNILSKKWQKSLDHSVNYISTFLKN